MASPLLNIGGLSSGLDTNAIIDQMMAIERLPRTKLDNKATFAALRQNMLAGFQTQLRAVEAAAKDLRSVTLFTQTQSVDSSDPTKATATTGSGAGVGGYQLEISQLANSAQRTFSFTSPASAGTITIDGHDTAIAAGASIGDVVAQINSDTGATVYAAATDSGTIVLSSRQTGDTGGGFIDVTATGGALTEQAAKARQGKDALFTVDGVGGTSSSNTVTNAIAGVSLQLKGVTTTSGPLTVTVGAPGASTEAITTKLQAFVDAYNTAVDAIQAKLTEKSVPDAKTAEDKQKGILFADSQLGSILSKMRQAIYAPIAGLPDGMKSLADLGVSTGSSSGVATKDGLAGKLTLDTKKLTAAATTNPGGVRDLLAGINNVGGWARSFEAIVHEADTTGGALDVRINGAAAEIKLLQKGMAAMDERLALKESSLRAQFAAMELALSRSQSQSGFLAGQLNALNNSN